MEYLGSDIDLHLGALFLLAFEDRSDIAREVLDALWGFSAGLCWASGTPSISVCGIVTIVSGGTMRRQGHRLVVTTMIWTKQIAAPYL